MIRAVVDTGILVRALIKPRGTVGPVLRRLRDGDYILLYASPLLEELLDVLARPRLRDRYGLTAADAHTVLLLIALRGEPVEPDPRIVACRDYRDDMFLQVAVAGRADVIVSGDEDLLVLSPFAGIPIVGPAAFLEMLDAAQPDVSRGRRRLLNESGPAWAASPVVTAAAG